MAKGDYNHLRAPPLLKTMEQLQARIAARFPDSGLYRVCGELIETARWSIRDAARLARPHWLWRILVVIVIVGGIAAQLFAAQLLHVDRLNEDAAGLVQGLEAAVNLLILFGAAAFFLLTLEERFKRRRALDAFYRLRSLAHIIDMHQLTKDPTVVLNAHQTTASPTRAMSQFELTRYLDYCAEMLALIGKLAALYADNMRDAVVLDAVNDIENLTSNLGRKIWQKITIISALEDHEKT